MKKVFSKERLLRAIKESGVTQAEIARKMGVQGSDVTRWVTPKAYAVEPGTDKLEKIAKIIGCSTDDFYYQTDPDSVDPSDAQRISLGVTYNAYGVDTVMLGKAVVWQTENPYIHGKGQKTVYWELPDLLADYLAKAMAVGLESAQGPQLMKRDAFDAVADAAGQHKGPAKKPRSRSGEAC